MAKAKILRVESRVVRSQAEIELDNRQARLHREPQPQSPGTIVNDATVALVDQEDRQVVVVLRDDQVKPAQNALFDHTVVDVELVDAKWRLA